MSQGQRLPARTDLAFLVAAGVFVALAVFGGYSGYTPVPFWDMWNGYLEFYMKTQAGDGSAWWVQHNEHRIVLARIFFWMDLHWFRGTGTFLVIVNYLLVATTCAVFLVIWRNMRGDASWRYFGFFLVAWLFSWTQYENLVWGFQSQFILAQLLPLAAFFLMHRATQEPRGAQGSFLLAITCGVLSLGTMANGLLALPLMTVYAAVARMGWTRVLLLASITGLSTAGYLHGYQTPANHGTLSNLLGQPAQALQYVLLYIGSPFFHVAPTVTTGLLAASCAASALVLGSVILGLRALRDTRAFSMELALLVFILYVGGTALGTAGGRLIFGVGQALAPRYATPTIMAWAAFFILLASPLVRLKDSTYRRTPWVAALVLLAMLPQQLKAVEDQSAKLFQYQVAALALELGVRDPQQIQQVYPDIDAALHIAQASSRQDLSIFASSGIRDQHGQIGKPLATTGGESRECQGRLEQIQPIAPESPYLRVAGWFFDPQDASPLRRIGLVDAATGHKMGAALTGQLRPDAANTVSPAAWKSGFRGYLLRAAGMQNLVVVDESTGCRFTARVELGPRPSSNPGR